MAYYTDCFEHSLDGNASCFGFECANPLYPAGRPRDEGCMCCSKSEFKGDTMKNCKCGCHLCKTCRNPAVIVGTSAGGAGVVGTSAAAAAALAPPPR